MGAAVKHEADHGQGDHSRGASAGYIGVVARPAQRLGRSTELLRPAADGGAVFVDLPGAGGGGRGGPCPVSGARVQRPIPSAVAPHLEVQRPAGALGGTLGTDGEGEGERKCGTCRRYLREGGPAAHYERLSYAWTAKVRSSG